MRPAPALLIASGLWLVFSLAAAIRPALTQAWLASGLIFLFLALLDLVLLWRSTLPVAQRHVAASLPVGVWHSARIRLSNAGGRRIRFVLHDHTPPDFETEALPQHSRLAADTHVDLSYRLRPLSRGDHSFGPIQLLVASPLGLWFRNLLLPAAQTVKVYPNFAEVAKYALFATDNRLSQIGIRKYRRRGEGLSFHQLREYRGGDALRQIDWNASARLKRLISREYQDERDQQVVFLIDCGRRMLAKDGELSHFDHALNALLLLSYVALRQGDGVGFLAFAGAARFLPPRKGAMAVNAVLNAVYDLQPTRHAPDYAQAATDLITRLRKRSLVVILSNLRDEDAEELKPALSLLRQQHLVVLASLQETVLNHVAQQEVRDFDDALNLAATQVYLEQRRMAHQALQRSGVLLLDVEPARLPVALVNRYLDIKLSGRL